MIVNVISSDYLDMVQERQRLEGLLEQGRREFSGYGLELFERGLRAKLDRLTVAIKQYDTQIGYEASYNLWTSKMGECMVGVLGGTTQQPSSFAFPNCCSVTTGNVQMIPGRVRDSVTIMLNATFPAATREPVSLAIETPSSLLRAAAGAPRPSLIFPGGSYPVLSDRQAAN